MPFFEQFSLRLSLRALGAAGLLAVATAGASYPTFVRIFSDPAVSSLAQSAEVPAAGLAAPESLAPNPAAVELPAAAAGSSDDPVAELVDIVS